MSDFVGALAAEIASLESALEKDVRYVRLRELRRVCILYEDAASSVSPPSITPVEDGASNSEASRQRASMRQLSPNRERALAAAKEYVAKASRVVPTRELLEYIISEGIEVGGANQLNNLSAIISTSGIFRSHGRKGWTIKDMPGFASEVLDVASIANDFAQELSQELSQEDITHLLDALRGASGVPSEYDRRLLSYAKGQNNGLLLTDEQLRALRMAFVEAIKTDLA